MIERKLPITALIAVISGLYSVIYLRTYWGSFYINPFPQISLSQLVVYSFNGLLATLFWPIMLYVLNYFIGFTDGYSARLAELRSRGTEKLQQAFASNPAGERLAAPDYFPGRKTKLILVATSTLLTMMTVQRVTSYGPVAVFPNNIEDIVFWVSWALLLVASRRYRAAMPEVDLKLQWLFLGVALAPLMAQLAVSDAQHVWDGSNNANIKLGQRAPATYGYIGVNGDRAYLLTTSTKQENPSRVVSVPASEISLIQPSPKSTSFRFKH